MDNKKKKRESGYSATELLTVIFVATLLLAIVITLAFQTSVHQKLRVFQYDANLFAQNAGAYVLESDADTVYLQSLIDLKLFANIKNPFSGTKYCDTYESKVVFKSSKQYVTLQCGNYLIEDQYAVADEYTIYKVSDWSTKKSSGSKQVQVEKMERYNYRLDGKEVLSQYRSEDVFLLLFNQAYRTKYTKVSQIPKKYSVVEKTYYRTKVKIDDVENKEK